MLSAPLALFGIGMTELIILGGIFLVGAIVVAVIVVAASASRKGRRDE